jgi:hypothetical protein
MEISIEARKTIGQQRIKIEAKAATREMGDSPSIEGHCMLSEVRVKSLGQFDMLRPPAIGYMPKLQAIDDLRICDDLLTSLGARPLHRKATLRNAKGLFSNSADCATLSACHC